MIQSNELRIGNWIWADDVSMPYQLTDFGMIVVQRSFDNRSPIILTPEILEKCGFERIAFLDFRHEKLPGFVFQYDNQTNLVEIIARDLKIFSPQNLHQLQNLYFALTGEELNIDL